MRYLIAFACIALLISMAGCKETCRPGDYDSGAICNDDGEVEMCRWEHMGFLINEDTDWYLETVTCPSYVPQCSDREIGGAICKGT